MSESMASRAAPGTTTVGTAPHITPKLTTTAFGLEEIWGEGERVARISKLQMAGQLGKQAWKSFIASPFTSALTVLTTAIVLFAFGAFVLVLENISSALVSRQSSLTVRLYLQDSSIGSESTKLTQEIQSQPAIERVELITKAQALAEFKGALGEQANLVAGLETENPLPASLDVRFKPSDNLRSLMDEFAERYHSHPAVAHVQYSHGVIGKLTELLDSFRMGGAIAIAIMFLIAAFVISITIRLALYSHRQEIGIMKLVGATNRFIKTPFLIEGAVQGLVGSLAAIALLVAALSALREGASVLSEMWAVGGGLRFLSPTSLVLMIIAGPLVGLVGSSLAVRRFTED